MFKKNRIYITKFNQENVFDYLDDALNICKSKFNVAYNLAEMMLKQHSDNTELSSYAQVKNNYINTLFLKIYINNIKLCDDHDRAYEISFVYFSYRKFTEEKSLLINIKHIYQKYLDNNKHIFELDNHFKTQPNSNKVVVVDKKQKSESLKKKLMQKEKLNINEKPIKT